MPLTTLCSATCHEMKANSAIVCPAGRGGAQFRSHKGLAHNKSIRHNNTDKLISFFTQLTFLAVWKSLATLSAPIAKVLAFYLWAGRSVLKLTAWTETLVLRLIGWLASPAFPSSRWLRQWGRTYVPLDVRKWHAVVGKTEWIMQRDAGRVQACLLVPARETAVVHLTFLWTTYPWSALVCLLPAAMMVSAALINSLIRRWRESFDEQLRQLRRIQERMAAANSYQEWREFAQQLDSMGHSRGGDSSGKIRENLYDRKLLQQKIQHLQSEREHGNGREMMFALRTDLIRNIANIAKRCAQAADGGMTGVIKPARAAQPAAVPAYL